VSSVATLGGYTTRTFGTAQAAAFKTGVAIMASVITPVAASDVTITSVTDATAAGRHLLAGSVNVSFSVATTPANAGALSTAIGATFSSSSTLLSVLQNAGLKDVTSVLLDAPTTGATQPVATTSLPNTSGAFTAAARAAITAALLLAMPMLLA
jgi:hypothetical protein